MDAVAFLALADSLRENADLMDLYVCDPRQTDVIRDCADDCDRQAFRLLAYNMTEVAA